MKPKTVGREVGTSRHPHPDIRVTVDTGLVPGTVVLTRDGETPVDRLLPGDRIITRDAGLVTLTRVECARHRVRAIFFAAGSLGDTRPDSDLVLPAGQPVLIRDWRAQALFGQPQALVRADALIDNEFIRDLGMIPIRLHRLVLDRPRVIYAGGLELGCGDGLPLVGRKAA